MIYDKLIKLYSEDDPPALPPKLVRHSVHLCAERTVSYRRYFEAQQAGARVDVVVQLPYVLDTPTECWAKLPDGHLYRVLQNQHTTDEDELPVSVISLEREAKHYDVKDDS